MKRGAADFTATPDVENASSEVAAAQRQAIDVRQKASSLRSSAVANAAESAASRC
jgi:hypothetical protein